jgi:hypothetical protein
VVPITMGHATITDPDLITDQDPTMAPIMDRATTMVQDPTMAQDLIMAHVITMMVQDLITGLLNLNLINEYIKNNAPVERYFFAIIFLHQLLMINLHFSETAFPIPHW